MGGPGAHQPPGVELIQGEDVAVAPRRLLLQHPLVQPPHVPMLGAVFVEGLAVQGGPVQVPVRHGQGVAQRLRQIHHPLHVVGPVVQGHIGNRLPRLGGGGLRVGQGLRPPGGAAAQQNHRQQQRKHSHLHKKPPLK